MSPTRRDQDAYTALRRAAIATLLGLVAFLVIADVLGRLLINDSFEVRDTTIGAILGALTMLFGITVLRGPKGGGSDE